MYKRFPVLLAVLALSICAQAQSQDDTARTIFVGSRREKVETVVHTEREKPTPTPAAVRRRTEAKPPAPSVARRKDTIQRRNRPPVASDNSIPQAASSDNDAEPTVGLGYTVFLKDPSHRFVRVNPEQSFRAGDSIRILVESNIDGYIYVFHKTDDGPTKMLFPDWDAHQGDNRIWAHYPQFVPDPDLFEFALSGPPAAERLTIVVSRHPIAGLPIGTGLQGLRGVPVREDLLREISRPVNYREYNQNNAGMAITNKEIARDVQMVRSDPPPDHILLNQQTNADRIISRLTIYHR